MCVGDERQEFPLPSGFFSLVLAQESLHFKLQFPWLSKAVLHIPGGFLGFPLLPRCLLTDSWEINPGCLALASELAVLLAGQLGSPQSSGDAPCSALGRDGPW